MTYPEHEKMKKVHEASQAIGEFLEFLESKGFTIERNEMTYRNFNGLLAEFFDVDLKKIELEKRAMLTDIQRLHDVGAVTFVEEMMFNEAEASVTLDRGDVGTYSLDGIVHEDEYLIPIPLSEIPMPSHGDKGE